QPRIEHIIADLLEAIGESPTRQGLRDTPQRVARMYGELFSGVGLDPKDAIDAVFDEESADPVILRNVSFYSVCEHHLLPFFGSASLAYVPNGRIAGISKLARSLDLACRRPQVQERLTGQVADAILTALTPQGVAVELEAEHLCMAMRGIQKQGARVVTTAVRGEFPDGRWDGNSLLALLRRDS
ncbi:GTP cyclohydrolase 1, partial [Geodia barretti]